MSIISKRLKSLRERKNLKQKEVAKDLSLTPYQLSRYENGNSKPDPDLILEFAKYYNVSTDYLLGNAESEENFETFINDPDLQVWYKELPINSEEELRQLKDIWEVIKKEKKQD